MRTPHAHHLMAGPIPPLILHCPQGQPVEQGGYGHAVEDYSHCLLTVYQPDTAVQKAFLAGVEVTQHGGVDEVSGEVKDEGGHRLPVRSRRFNPASATTHATGTHQASRAYLGSPNLTSGEFPNLSGLMVSISPAATKPGASMAAMVPDLRPRVNQMHQGTPMAKETNKRMSSMFFSILPSPGSAGGEVLSPVDLGDL